MSQGSTLLSVSKVPKQPFWKYWPITCKFFTELHRNLPCGVCSHHTFSQNVRLSFKPLCYQSKLRWHWLNFFAKTKKTRFPIQTSLQLLSATKMHVKDVKDLTKISVPQCENGKKVITERCCFPRFKFIKVFQWSDISPTVWHMCALCVFRCADTILLWKWLKWTSWCQNSWSGNNGCHMSQKSVFKFRVALHPSFPDSCSVEGFHNLIYALGEFRSRKPKHRLLQYNMQVLSL